MTESPYRILVKAAVMVALMAAAVALAISAPQGLPGAEHYTVRAAFQDIGNLQPHNEVRIAGRRVGQVLRPRVEGGRAVVDLQLDEGTGPLGSDSRVMIRSKGLLGQRFVEILPGRGGALADGALIPSERTGITVDVPELLSTFDAPTRRRLGSLLDGLGGGFLSRGEDLSEAIAEAPALLRDSSLVARELLAREGAASRLVPSLEGAAREAEPARDDFAQGFDPEARALAPFADRRPYVTETLDEAPGALASAESGLRASRRLLSSARRLATATTATLDRAPVALRQTRLLLAESRRPLDRTRQLLDRAGATVPPLLEMTRALGPVLPRLERGLEASLPLVVEIGGRGCDVSHWAENWRSMLGYGVRGGGEIGHLGLLRLEFIGGGESVGGAGPELRQPSIGRNPYPDPCEAGTEALP